MRFAVLYYSICAAQKSEMVSRRKKKKILPMLDAESPSLNVQHDAEKSSFLKRIIAEKSKEQGGIGFWLQRFQERFYFAET